MDFCEAVFKSVGFCPRMVYIYQQVSPKKIYPQANGKVSCPVFSRKGKWVGYIAIKHSGDVNVGLTMDCKVTDFVAAAKIAAEEYKKSLLSVA